MNGLHIFIKIRTILSRTYFLGHCTSVISRGNENLGYLILETHLDVIAKKMDIHNEDKRAMAFFKSKAPNEDRVRAAHPSYVTPVGIYSIELIYKDVCNYGETIMTSACYVYARVCLNVAKFESNPSKNKYLTHDSPKLKELWRSLRNYKKPYDINALEIKFNHADLTGEVTFEAVREQRTQRKLKLIVEVWVGGTEGDAAPPIRTAYCTYSVYKLLDAAGYSGADFDGTNQALFPFSKIIRRNFIRLADLKPPEIEEEVEEEGFFSKMFGLKKDDSEEEEKDESKSTRNRNSSRVESRSRSKSESSRPRSQSQVKNSTNSKVPVEGQRSDRSPSVVNANEDKSNKTVKKEPWWGRTKMAKNMDPDTDAETRVGGTPGQDQDPAPKIVPVKKSFTFWKRKDEDAMKKEEMETEIETVKLREMEALTTDGGETDVMKPVPHRRKSIVTLTDLGNLNNNSSRRDSVTVTQFQENNKLALEDEKKKKKKKRKNSKCNMELKKELEAATTYRDPMKER